jgi:hypothetical protein
MRHRAWATVAICTAVTLVAIEATLRLIGLGDPPIAVRDPELEYRLVPNATYRRWGNRIEIGDHGFRAASLPKKVRDNEVRLLLIGDSVVYGNHFLDQDETISSRLSALLSTPTCTVRVIPMAISSWGPMNQAAALERHGTFGASEVAVVLSGHDIFDTPLPNGSLVPYRLSQPTGAIGDAIEAVIEHHLPPAIVAPILPTEERVRLSLNALDRIADEVTAADAELRLVYNATTQERQSGISDGGKRISDWSNSRGVPLLHLGRFFDISYRDDIHPDAKGVLRISEALAEWYSDKVVCNGLDRSDR